jgi:hypothetical protein
MTSSSGCGLKISTVCGVDAMDAGTLRQHHEESVAQEAHRADDHHADTRAHRRLTIHW